MNILIIGGGRQLGKYLVKIFDKLDEVKLTIFNRGLKSSYFNNNKHIIGDRNKDIHVFENSYFNYIIDTCAYNENKDFKAFEYLSQRSGKYVLISSSFVQIIENKIRFNKTIIQSEKENILNYSIQKKNLENKLKNLSNNYIIFRPVPLISEFDHTNRTLTLIKFLKQFKSVIEVPKIQIQLDSANIFASNIVKSLSLSNQTVNNAGAILKLEEIYEFLNLQDYNSENNNIKKLPYIEFMNNFSGHQTDKNEILKIFKKVHNKSIKTTK